MNPRGKKQPNSPKNPPAAGKQPHTSPVTDADERPSWGFSILDCAGPFGRRVTLKEVMEILDFLPEIERLSWKAVTKRPSKHHHVPRMKICKEAQQRLKNRDIHAEALISLRMTAKKRIWGIREGTVFHLLWWDPEHEVCPTEKRHT